MPSAAFLPRLAIVGLSMLAGCHGSEPSEEVAVALPMFSATASVQVWGDTSSEGRFDLVVETPNGSVRRQLWEDWGPAQRVNLYVTPEDWLVALGAGDTAVGVQMYKTRAPKNVPYAALRRAVSEDWTYIGAVDREVRHLRYYSLDERLECVPLFADPKSVSVPYRRAYQSRTC